jgi:hypothetical protein
MNTLHRVTYALQARALSTTWQKNIRVRQKGMMRRRMMMRKRKAWSDRICEHERGRKKDGKLQGENMHDMQDQAECD